MKPTLLLLVCMLLALAPAFAIETFDAQDIEVLTAQDGNKIIVQGEVVGIETSRSDAIYLYMGFPRGQRGMAAIISSDVKAKFPADPNDYLHKVIRVTGKMAPAGDGRPRIFLQTPEDIEVAQ